ncbi:glucosamine-6-phosphate deaminase [Subtercola boreus]|uniref:Glucosamine-6-phosphate deaminase n=1 Tax=Subtercola boreus TaxID=120213 RepID=A0A3E0VAV3_9MICO|nr:glucosamine-6-phosphate deaminase [Subtercola boreus]RFA06861.1 glucosamine-6-phosphate deaminase [Subtercola boreus]
MQVVILNSEEEIRAYASEHILARVETGALSVLGVATGSSPLPIYEGIEQRWTPAVGSLTAFALDEYVGLQPSHPESYHAVIDREVTQRLKLDPKKVHVPDGTAANVDEVCEHYEDLIKEAGGIDLQILGIGATGHIGFNEPTSSFASRTRIKTLTPQTRRDNARFFNSIEEVPRHCLTQGLGTIMEARELLLVAMGTTKAEAVAQAIEGPLTSMCPGSLLQMHPRATVILDRQAASHLKLVDYYNYVFNNRPTK